jgi:hypothetical protein
MEEKKIPEQNFSIQENHWKVGSTHKLSDNLVVPITISLDRSLLGCKLMSLN